MNHFDFLQLCIPDGSHLPLLKIEQNMKMTVSQ